MSFNDLSKKEAAGKSAADAKAPKPQAGTDANQAAAHEPGADKKA